MRLVSPICFNPIKVARVHFARRPTNLGLGSTRKQRFLFKLGPTALTSWTRTEMSPTSNNFWKLINSTSTARISLCFTPIDGSWNVLSKVFWLQLDLTKRSAAKIPEFIGQSEERVVGHVTFTVQRDIKVNLNGLLTKQIPLSIRIYWIEHKRRR